VERPLGVCIIDENMSVPADRRVWSEAKALREAGYSVSVICPKPSGCKRSREILDGIEIYRYPAWEGTGVIGHLLEYAWALPMQFLLAAIIYLRSGFDILQACNPPDNIFLIALFLKPFGVRFVFDQHDPVPELCQVRYGRKGLLYRAACLAERLTFRVCHAAIASNASCREIALNRGKVSPCRSFVVRGVPDLNDFQPLLPRPSLKQGFEHLVVYVGVMGPQDGCDLLLKSIDYLVNQKGRRDTLFAFVGMGSELQRLKKSASAYGLDSWVRFTGPLYGNDLKDYFATADVGVAPDPANAFNDKLTMLKILEYMACRMPVVLFDLPEGRRTAGEAAMYAAGNDPVDFGEKIRILLDSPSLRRELGSAGRRRIESHLNWRSEKQELLRAYAMAAQDLRSPCPTAH